MLSTPDSNKVLCGLDCGQIWHNQYFVSPKTFPDLSAFKRKSVRFFNCNYQSSTEKQLKSGESSS